MNESVQVFVYEFISGGGLEEQPTGSLLHEGRAMARALVHDFQRIENVRVVTTLDERLPSNALDIKSGYETTLTRVTQENHMTTFEHLCSESDCTLIVAPEFAGILARMTRRATESGGRLLSPDVETVSLFSNKQSTAEWLSACDIPSPQGQTFSYSNGNLPSVNQPFPIVVKPVDGAGSVGVTKANSPDDLRDLRWSEGETYRIETFIPGTPASISILCNETSPVVLPPCEQLFRDRSFDYDGGRLLPPGELAARATRLGNLVAKHLPTHQGYVGVDMVLGNEPCGRNDRVIEINPRITTSYVGLRAATDDNLAEVMLRPRSNIDLRFPRRQVEFRSDGTILEPSSTSILS